MIHNKIDDIQYIYIILSVLFIALFITSTFAIILIFIVFTKNHLTSTLVEDD